MKIISKIGQRLAIISAIFTLLITQYSAHAASFLQPVINTEEAVEMAKSTIFDASQSFIPAGGKPVYTWDFGDGNRNEGQEVLHQFREPGNYTVTLTIRDGELESSVQKEVFAYRKLILLVTDQTHAQERIELINKYAQEKGVYLKIVESFGSSTEFISEEILTKKLNEEWVNIQKAGQIIIWTKENAGLNALSRAIQANPKKQEINFTQKTIAMMEENLLSDKNRIQREFQIIGPENILLIKEASLYPLIESLDNTDLLTKLKTEGYEFEVIDEKSIQIRPWRFMSYFVNFLVNKGIPDNTIALLLLLPVIATVVVVLKQVVGITTFGIYTPTIITLSFLVIGIHAGLLTLLVAIVLGVLSSYALKKIRMLFLPRMAVQLTIVSLGIFGILILSTFMGLFNAEFLSIAIFPMLILSTLVEKFLSVKTEKGLSSAILLTCETVLAAIVAYIIAGGEFDLGIVTLQMDFVRRLMLLHPEIIFLLLALNFFLGKWTGLRLLELIRFREVLRHIEE